jgi:hypothetical protein
MASRLTLGAQGAASGASIGTALAPGVGTAIGAGVGALGGALMGGETDAERMQRERMEELMRRQELGQLGLTDQEMNVALGQAQGALSQQQQAQRAQQAGLLATTGVGAGAAMRAGQEEAAQERREMAEARQRVEEADVAQRRAEEEQLVQLGALEQQRAAQEREALISALGETATQVYMGGQLAQQRATAREQKAKLEEDARAAYERELARRRAGQSAATVDADFEQISGGGFQQTTADVVAANQPMGTGRAADGLFPMGGALGPSFLAESAESALLRSGLDPALIDQLMLRAGGNPDVLREYIMRAGGRI